MKKTMVVCICTFLTLSVMTMPARAEVTVNDIVPLNINVLIPCANDGAGEFVNITGDLHVVISANVNGNRTRVKSHFQPQGASGTGAVTGDTYRGVGVTQSSSSGSLQNGSFQTSFNNNFRMIGQGPGNNFMVHTNSQITVNANGDLTASHSFTNTSCS